MKQIGLFGEEFSENKSEKKYTKNVSSPIYDPKNKKPHLLELYDNSKSKRLANEIRNSNLSEDEKSFLLHAAQRHTVFNYERIADYYAHSSKEMQELMERSALVIIDFEKAIQYGFVKLSDNIKKTYLTDFENEK